MQDFYKIPELPLPYDLGTKEVLRQVNRANRRLAELKGVATTIPNEGILISTLTLQEAKESSEVENILTTQDELHRADLHSERLLASAAEKEVLNYREAIIFGFESARKDRILSNSKIKRIQEKLEGNRAGFRAVPGTSLKDSHDRVVYMPPQDGQDTARYMGNLEQFINDPELCDVDPLIKMAIIHHQFESIHPFYDGNGRTGRIINILYLITNGLLDLPILYLSRYITQHKAEYYRLFQAIRARQGDNEREWKAWILFILKGVEETAEETIALIQAISALKQELKQRLRPLFGRQYKHELLNNLFFHPYTKIEFMERDLMVQRKTAAKYLDRIVEEGLVEKVRMGRENYFINSPLISLFVNHSADRGQ